MRKLARTLGVEAMSLYHHVPDKGAILDGIVAAIYGRIPDDPLPAEAPWTEQLVVAMHRFRAVLLAHPAALPVMATRSVTGVAGLGLIDMLLQSLRAAGLPPMTALTVINCVATYTLGHSLAWSERTTPELPRQDPDLILREVAALPRTEYPGMWWAFGPCLDGEVDPSAIQLDGEREFDLGLRAMLTGLERALREAGQLPAPEPGGSGGPGGLGGSGELAGPATAGDER